MVHLKLGVEYLFTAVSLVVKAVKWRTAVGPEEVHQELESGTDRIIEFKNPFCDWSNFLSVLNRRLLNILDVFEFFSTRSLHQKYSKITTKVKITAIISPNVIKKVDLNLLSNYQIFEIFFLIWTSDIGNVILTLVMTKHQKCGINHVFWYSQSGW